MAIFTRRSFIFRIALFTVLTALALTAAAYGSKGTGNAYIDQVREFLGLEATATNVLTPPSGNTAEPNSAQAMEPMFFAPTTVTIGGGASVTCPATPTATYTTPPAGVSFSNWSRGGGVTCATAADGLSGSGFNTADAATSFAANKYYKVTIAADPTHTFTLSSITWLGTISSGTGTFAIKTSNNGGAATDFGAAVAGVTGSAISATFNGSVVVAAGTSVDVFLIASNTGAAGTTVRFKNNSTITIDATTSGASSFYSAATGNLDNVNTWWSNPDGATGTHPANFSTAGQTFNIRNNPTPTTGGAWTVSGAGSKVVVGDGTNACNFTIPAGIGLTGTVDVSAAATLTIRSTSSPTFGTLAGTSTVVYDGTGAQAITATNYGNLTLSNTGSLSLSGTAGISGTFTPGSVPVPTGTFDFNGSGAQTIPAFNYVNLISSNTGARTLAPVGTIGIAGTFTPGTNVYTMTGSTIDFNALGSQTVNAINYNNLTISGSRGVGTVTLASGTIGVADTFNPSATFSGGGFSVTGNTVDFSGAGSQTIPAFKYNSITNSGNGPRTLASTGTVGIGGTFLNGSGTYTTTGSTVDFSSASGGSVPVLNYNNLTISGTGVFILANTTSITGTYTQSAGAFNVNGSAGAFGRTFNIGGDFNLLGGKFNLITLAAHLTTTVNVTGNATLSGTGTSGIYLEVSSSTNGAGVFNVNGNFIVTAVGTSSSLVDFGNGTLATDMTGNAVRIKGNFSKAAGSGSFFTNSSFPGTGFVFNGTGTQTFSYAGTNSLYTQYVVNSGSTLVMTTGLVLGDQTNPRSTFTANGTLDTGTNVISSVNTNAQFTLGSGATFKTANTGGVDGSITVTGTRTFTAGTNYTFNGTSPQVTSAGMPTAVGNFTIDNSGGSTGVTLSAATSIAGTLALTNGKLTTTSSLLPTVTNQLPAAITIGTGYVNGPIKRNFIDNAGPLQTYVFPVGKGSYNPFEIVAGTTGAATSLTAEVFDTGSGGTVGAGLSALNGNRHWLTTLNSGSLTAFVRLTDAGLTAANRLGASATETGVYSSVGDNVVGSTIMSTQLISSYGSYEIGTKPPPDIAINTAPADPTTNTFATFTYSSDDPAATFECEIDGAGFTPCSSSGITYNSLAVGPHTFRARAKDANGIYDPTPVTYNWTIAVGYNITYLQDGNGTLTGNAIQVVSPGGNGTPVTAVPNAGYHFVNWSPDNNTNPTRSETNVTADAAYTANFAPTRTIALGQSSMTFAPTLVGSSAADQTSSVTGTNLTANISCSLTTGTDYLISSDNSIFGSSASFTQSGGSASGTLYVRFTPAAGGARPDTVTCSSTGATDQAISLAGGGYLSTYVVNTNVDGVDASPGDGACETAAGNNICTLRAAIQETNALAGAQTITFDASTNGTPITADIPRSCSSDNDVEGDLDVTQSLTVTGNGAANTVIQACPTAGGCSTACPTPFLHFVSNRVFDVHSGTFTMSGVTVRHGTDEGGGIFMSDGTTLLLSDSTIGPNNGFGTGFAGIRIGGQGSGSTATITNSLITGNTDQSGIGGGIGGVGTLTITGSSITGNTAYQGGGIGMAGALTLTDSTVSGNTAGNRGAGLYLTSGASTITGSTISGNTATFCCGPADGGGIYAGGTTSTGFTIALTNSTISGNTATGNGGAIYNDFSQFTLKNVTITGNTAAAGTAVHRTANGSVSAVNTILGGTCNTTLTSLGYNLGTDTSSNSCGLIGTGDLLSASAGLGSLANNGGPTQTHALLDTSVARDQGSAVSGVTTDQRAQPRPHDDPNIANAAGGDGSDIGAYEVQTDVSPAVTGIAPTTGTTAGGTSVTITGTGLSGATAVNFGGTPATGLTGNTATSITVLSPAHVAGTVDVTVITAAGTSPTTANDQYTYVAPATHSVTYAAGGGTGTAPTQADVVEGASFTVAANTFTRAGYTFSGWFDGTNTYQPGNSYTMGTVNVTLTAQWAVDNHTVTFNGNTSTGGATPPQTTNLPAALTLNGFTKTGYTFVDWATAADGSGTHYANGATYSFAADLTLYAQWSINQYTLTYTAGPNGSLTGTSPQTVSYGGSGTAVTAVPDAGYHFVNWSDSSTANPRTDTNVQANISVTANFAINVYTVNYISDPNGSISGQASQNVNHGGSTTPVTALANTGYHFVDWSPDGSTANPRSDANVTANATYTANFAINTYSITVLQNANGLIFPGTTVVNYGSSQSFTIAAAANYHIADVVVDGSSVGAVASYDFTNVTANHTITATYAIDTYTITATAGANGSIAPAGATLVNYNGSQAYTITPNSGYHVAGVLVDGVSVGAVTAYTFSNVAANHTIAASFAIDTYTITASAGANGSIAPAGATVVNSGDNQAYTITPNAGYHINDVLVDGGSVGVVGVYTFTNVTANHTIAASFAINQYALTTNGVNCTVARNPDQALYDHGTTVQLTATPLAGYHFVNWTGDLTSSTNPDSVTMTANRSVTANCAINTYPITASAGAGGSIAPVGVTNVNHGGSQAYTITPDAHYHIADVLVDGVSVGAVATYTFSNVTASHTIAASFAIDTFTIAVTQTANGTIAPGTTVVNYDGSQTFTITPALHYHIADVVVDGSSVGAVASYDFTHVAANHSITATYAIDTYTITATAGANGSIAPAGATVVSYGGSQGYTITPAAHYHIADVLVDGVSVGAVATYTFSSVSANHTITASFAIDTYTITASAGANGSIAPSGAVLVSYGDTPTFTITANTGYHIADVLVDGVSVGVVASYQFAAVGANHTIAASFAINTYTITATAGAGGSIAPSGATVVSYGGSQAYTITANANYHIADVVVDGVSVGAAANYTFSSVSANHTIVASFAIDTYTITATAGAGGSIAPAGATVVNYGGSQAYTITPNANYHIADVLVDGVPVGAVANYTFSSVAANHTIAASFAVNTYTITASAGAGGSISPAGTVTVGHGSNQAFTITPDAGNTIADVLVDGVSVGATSSYTFTNVTANGHTIAASFAAGAQAAVVYVDDDWTGVLNGIDPDGSGPATSIGYDAFATIQAGVAGVAANGDVIVNPGSYTGDVDINRVMDVHGVFTLSGALTVSAAGASVSPGFSPGIINTGNLSLTPGTTLNIELNGTTPGTQHDQVNVTGTVSLGNADLAVTLGPIYNPSPGQSYTIINNDSVDAVTGTFNGLPQGSVFFVGAVSFQIDYAGGSGNDVVLTTVALCNDVSIPTGISTPAATTVTVPVNTDSVTGHGLLSFDTTINYNPSVIASPTVNLTPITSGSLLSVNNPSAGVLVISVFRGTPFAGAGPLVNIDFNVTGQPGTSSAVTFGSFQFNEGTPCLHTSGGSVNVISGTISGTVLYGNPLVGLPVPRPVPGVSLNAAGSIFATGLSDGSGVYSLGGMGGGAYTVTPTKSGGVNGAVTGFDAARIAQHVVGAGAALTANQLIAADVSGTGGVTSFDAALIARYTVLLPNAGSSGTWKFVPASRSYANVFTNHAGDDYTAILMGDVSGNWNEPTSNRSPIEVDAERGVKPVRIAAPAVAAATGSEILVPVSVAGAADKGIVSYEFEIGYDADVIRPQANAVELSDTVSQGMAVAANEAAPGVLKVVVYGRVPLGGDGALLVLRFNAVGAPGTTSPLVWQQLKLNEGEPALRTTDGSVQITAASNETAIGGRLLSSMGQGVANTRITLTDVNGVSRTVLSSSLGYFRFDGLTTGQTYTIRAESRNFTFQPVTVSAGAGVTSVDVIAEP